MGQDDRTSRRCFLGTAVVACIPGSREVEHAANRRPEAARWRLGCYTRPWDRFDYRVALDGIAEAGFEYAGILTHKGKSWIIITPQTTRAEAEQVGEEVRKRGLKTISVFGDFAVGDSPVRAIEDLRRLIEHCAACGSPNLLLGGTADTRAYAGYYRAIAAGCDFAVAQGVGLSIKLHGGQNSTGPQCRQAIERVGHPNFRLWYDPGNIYYYSQGTRNPVDDSATIDGLVVGMSVKDFRPPGDVMLTPGTGRVDFKNVLSRLQKGGFTGGPLVVECLAGGDAKQITGEARKAMAFLKELTTIKF